ncbi:MAG: hypothetical protein Q8K33_22185 [Cypionkella sp.]|uniref:hypothetical protein n=1 Tax=Cypionkella sp. TaxID=2811411 RepID=UPI002730CC27|nr:hypothetical protein [Cypionkella sp.]MDP2051536.1 hypothetical protein [Cypionkella sp.]
MGIFARHTNIVDGSLFAAYADSMKSDAFNHMIATALTTPKKTVIVYARLLKEAGMLTTGARGRHAPEMTPLDAARMTLAILTTESPSQCVERVRRFGQIKYSPGFKKNYRGYEPIQPDHFAKLFNGETLEEVLAYVFGLPASLGLEESCKWFDQNVFHLRVFDFDVLAELYQWKMEGKEIVGELVVPFKGQRLDEGFTFIKGGVRTERSISGMSFLSIGLGLMLGDQDEAEGL